MDILENLDTIISVICGIGSIIMFFMAKNEKNECLKIKTTIENSIQITEKKTKIQSQDNFKINHVKNFDNRKSIK